MIRINLTDKSEIITKHFNGLQIFVKNKIISKRSVTTNPNLINFLDFLESNVETLLCGNKSELQRIVHFIESNYFISNSKLSKILRNRKRRISPKELNSYLINYAKETQLVNHLPSTAYFKVRNFEKEVKNLSIYKWPGFEKVLEDIFDYKGFTQKTSGWSAYDLVSELDVNVCPYCNRSFVSILKIENKRTRPVLDHYYAKSLYPYLALSLFNLIPSCYVCNSSFKGDTDFYRQEAIYPYEEEFSDFAIFKTDFNETEPFDYRYLLGISKEFQISIVNNATDKETRNKINTSVETFALDAIYNKHQDVVRDLIRNAVVNNTSRINEIYNSFPDLFNSREDVMQSLYLNYLDKQNAGKRPLSKLTQDICREMGLFNT
jgi:5-methylcytosine-specific restriction endonuclease McrA